MLPQISLGRSELSTSRLAYGCWRIAESKHAAENLETGRAAILAAAEAGYTLFDLADIYCAGRSEEVLGAVLREQFGLRERLVIATKCGIRLPDDPHKGAPYRYDMSAAHIERSCEDSLSRLGIETIDLYQLHRPDYLLEPEEVAATFSRLRAAGKVREFGVSNFRSSQVTLLQRACDFPLLVNQVEISLLQQTPLDDGTLDQCLTEKITPLAWSPLAGGQLADGAHGVLPAQEKYQPKPAIAVLDEIARARGTSRMAIALAWLLKHPAGIVPIFGSTKPERIRASTAALSVELTREEWYRLLAAGRTERLS